MRWVTAGGLTSSWRAAAAGIALINSIGTLGGYIGPFVVGWINYSTHGFQAGLYFLATCALASAFLALLGMRGFETRATRGRCTPNRAISP